MSRRKEVVDCDVAPMNECLFHCLFAFALLGIAACPPALTSQRPSENRPQVSQPQLATRMGWQASEVFADSSTVAICAAIDRGDIEEVRRLLAEGGDVNDYGIGQITPLLWAFDGQLACSTNAFEELIRMGADPQIPLTKEFVNDALGVPEILFEGDSVAILVCQSRTPRFFDAVFNSTGDPNFVDSQFKQTPLFFVLSNMAELLDGERRRRVEALIKAGADVNFVDSRLQTPLIYASANGRWVCANLLLQAEADPTCYDTRDWQVIHHVAMSATSMREMRLLAEAGLRSPEPAPDAQGIIPRADLLASYRSQLEYCDQFDEVVAMLAERGFDLAEAERDLKLARHYAEQGDPFYFKKRRQKREAEGLDQPARPEAAEQR